MSGLSRDEQIIRQFFDDGANGNRARRALDRLVAAIPPTRDGTEGAERRMVAEIPFDPTNHHNALKCPYCNPEGLTFAPPKPAPDAV